MASVSYRWKVKLSITRDNGGSGDRLRGLPFGAAHVGVGGGFEYECSVSWAPQMH